MKKLAKQLSEISDELQKETEEFQKKYEKYSNFSMEDYDEDSEEYLEINDLQSDILNTIETLCEELENIFDENINKKLYTSKRKNTNGTCSYIFGIRSEKRLPDVSILTDKIEDSFYKLLNLLDESLWLQNYEDPGDKNKIEFCIHDHNGTHKN